MSECPLTKKQLEILSRLDKPLEQAAKETHITTRTLTTHLEKVRLTLGVKSTLQAVFIAFREGWIK